MSRTAARHHQADVARALRAAKQVGAGSVRLFPDGTIRIDLQGDPLGDKAENSVDDGHEVVL